MRPPPVDRDPLPRRARALRRAGGGRVQAVLTVLVLLASGSDPSGAAPEASPAREVVVKTADGLELRGAYHPAATPGGPGVVLLPAFRSDRTSWDPVLAPLRDRGIHVLALDPRGHGRSAKPGTMNLAPLVEQRDPRVFAAMHADAIAAVRWLVQQAGCDAKRVAIAGASVGGSVAVDAAARYPGEVAAVAWLSPGSKYLGRDSVAALAKIPAAVPFLLLVHRSEWDLARPVADARPAARVVVYDEPAPPAAGAERAWAHGTRMLQRLPLVDRTVASFVAAATGSKSDDVVLDGIVTTKGPNADPWDRAAEMGVGAGEGTLRAYRVGRRVVFGGTAGRGVAGLRFEVQTGIAPAGKEGDPFIGPPQVVAVDLRRNEVTWSWGGMGSIPTFPGMGPRELFGKTYPTLRAVTGEEGTTFEGEWFVPAFNDASAPIRLVASFTEEPPPRPWSGAVDSYSQFSVEVPAR